MCDMNKDYPCINFDDYDYMHIRTGKTIKNTVICYVFVVTVGLRRTKQTCKL